MMKGLIFIWLSLRFLLAAPAEDTSTLTVRLLDQNEQPVAGVIVELVLIQYHQDGSGEEIPFGNCTTRMDGRCSFRVTDPPRLWDGYIQGWLAPREFGRQLVGWYGEQAEVILLLEDFYLAATLTAEGFPPRDGPYEGQHSIPLGDSIPFGDSKVPSAMAQPMEMLTATPSESPAATSTLTYPTVTPEAASTSSARSAFVGPWFVALLILMVLALLLVRRKKKDSL